MNGSSETELNEKTERREWKGLLKERGEGWEGIPHRRVLVHVTTTGLPSAKGNPAKFQGLSNAVSYKLKRLFTVLSSPM